MTQTSHGMDLMDCEEVSLAATAAAGRAAARAKSVVMVTGIVQNVEKWSLPARKNASLVAPASLVGAVVATTAVVVVAAAMTTTTVVVAAVAAAMTMTTVATVVAVAAAAATMTMTTVVAAAGAVVTMTAETGAGETAS